MYKSRVKGSNNDCAFTYSTTIARMTDYNIERTDDSNPIPEIFIVINGTDLATVSNRTMSNIYVTIAKQNCLVINLNNNWLRCKVSIVTVGSYLILNSCCYKLFI